MIVNFEYYYYFGGIDCGDTCETEADFTDREYELLKQARVEGTPWYKVPELKHIYEELVDQIRRDEIDAGNFEDEEFDESNLSISVVEDDDCDEDEL